ncbi:MAG: transcription termination/antitermination NusG family protein [Deltaproteobacteria bacterium]|nr:transcription termination/antitermination NusG family protein [Deltaproteobacteria bacterium]
MKAQNSKQWYVVQTKPQKEESVYQLFVRGGFNAFFPKIKTFIRARGRSASLLLSERVKPLFPSYLFINMNLDDYNGLRTIRYTRGVNKIIGDGEGPIAIGEELIDTIREKVGEKGFIEQGALLQPGDKVLVKRGVLSDLIGILEKPIDDKGRVEVLLKIVHHQMRAKIFVSDLEKM